MRAYFGGFLCSSWSPTGRFLACGGEDDLITVMSTETGKIVARCQETKLNYFGKFGEKSYSLKTTQMLLLFEFIFSTLILDSSLLQLFFGDVIRLEYKFLFFC